MVVGMSGEYPTEEEVEKVRAWTFEGPESFEAFMVYVKSIGNYWPAADPFGWKQDGRTYHVSTGGWSGNEEILGAMQDNFIFWSVCWHQHNRGGHYVFTLPNPKTYFTRVE